MKSIARLAIPLSFALVAFGVQAQSIETDYPAVIGNVGIPAASSPAGLQGSSGTRPDHAKPRLLQSNNQGPVVNSAYARTGVLARAQLPAGEAEPLLVQSNNEGPVENPAYTKTAG